MGDYLSWGLGSIVPYTAGEKLEAEVAFEAPSDGMYYMLGALYTPDLSYIEGSLFGVLQVDDGAVNSATHMTRYALVAGDSHILDCEFTLSSTDVILGLFLIRMTGDEPSLSDDRAVSSITASLVGPLPPEPVPEVDMTSLITMVMMVGVMATGMALMLKEV